MKKRFFPIWIVCYEIVLYLASDIYLPALEITGSDLQLTTQEALSTISFWFLGNLVSTPFAGFVSGILGRKRTIVMSCLIFAVLNVMVPLIETKMWFFFFRFFQGFLVCLLTIPGYAMVHDHFSEKDSVRVISYMSAATVIAPLLGPLAGSVVVSFGSWRMGFLLLGVCAAMLIYPLYITLPATLPKEETVERATPEQITRRVILAYLLGLACAVAMNWVWTTASPLVMMQEFGITLTGYGYTQALSSVAYVGGVIVANRLISRYTARELVERGRKFIACGVLGLALDLVFPESLIVWLATWCAFVATAGFLLPPLLRVLMTSPLINRDYAAATICTFMNMGTAGGSAAAAMTYNGNRATVLHGVLGLGACLVACLALARSNVSSKGIE